MTGLNELFNRVGLATGPDRDLDADLCRALDKKSWDKYRNWASMPCGAPEDVIERDAEKWADLHTSSVDAALTLALRLLPHHRFAVFTDGQGRGPCCLIMVGDDPVIAQEFGKTLPLAILAALLSALIAKESSNDQ